VNRLRRRELTREQIQEALDLIKKQAAQIRTVDRDDLEGELARRLILEVRRSRSNIRNWRAYVKGLLRKKSSNWIRDWRSRWEDKVVVLAKKDDTKDDVMDDLSNAHDTMAESDYKISVDQFCEKLDPKLRRMCRLLEQRKWSVGELADALGVSRRTVPRWRRKIRQLAKRYGL
jgi:RNA polymerase sigma factor (sigma-70 family)